MSNAGGLAIEADREENVSPIRWPAGVGAEERTPVILPQSPETMLRIAGAGGC
jgi:hypothetical protein